MPLYTHKCVYTYTCTRTCTCTHKFTYLKLVIQEDSVETCNTCSIR